MVNRRIEILRLDHREVRDQRITSHVALTARTFGSDAFTYSGDRDTNLEKSIQDVSSRWGGSYAVKHISEISSYLRNWDGIIIHLTMYGEKHYHTIKTLEQFLDQNLLIIIGGAKVPRYVYELSDFNTALGWQPHSEVAAIGIFLYALTSDNLMYTERDDAMINIKKNSIKSRRSDRFKHG